jgi:flagellar P-ring protein precursor FlgI
MPITLEGVGIVTGLANTGDSKGAALELLRKYMRNMDFNFDAGSLATGSVALVRVSAELPPFSRPGQRFSVEVSALNAPKSLVGGTLLTCDLFANVIDDPDGRPKKVFASATGQVMVGTNVLTRGKVPDGMNSGAQQIETYPFGKVVNRRGEVRLNLKHGSWADAYGIARQINQTPSLNPYLQETTMFAEAGPSRPVAYAMDAGQVMIQIPEQFRYSVTRYISDMLAAPVTVERPATILVNRGKNSIVVTGDIQVNNAMISIQDKTVTIRPETEEEPAAYTLENATPRGAVEIEGPGTYANLQSLIDTLNAMGMNTEQVIIVFEQLREAGAIRARLDIQ